MIKNKLFIFLILNIGYKCCSNNIEELQHLIHNKLKDSFAIFLNSKKFKNVGFNKNNPHLNGEKKVIKNLIKQNDVVIDAGANVGDWSNMVFKHTNCQIYAFEPVPAPYNILKHRFSNQKNITTLNMALSRSESLKEMLCYTGSNSIASTFYIRPSLNQLQVTKAKVSTLSLDKFTYLYKINYINFLKIDTEGSELEILLGAKNILDKIEIIQFEYGGTYQDAGITLKQVYSFLESNNYLIFRIFENGLIYIPSWNNDLENYYYSNYLAIKKISSILQNKRLLNEQLQKLKKRMKYDEIITGKLKHTVNQRNLIKQTALMLAAALNDLGTVKNLITHNAAANLQDINGNTYLHYAIYNNSNQLADFLKIYKNGFFLAYYNIPNNQGTNAYQLAKQKNNTTFIQAIESCPQFKK